MKNLVLQVACSRYYVTVRAARDACLIYCHATCMLRDWSATWTVRAGTSAQRTRTCTTSRRRDRVASMYDAIAISRDITHRSYRARRPAGPRAPGTSQPDRTARPCERVGAGHGTGPRESVHYTVAVLHTYVDLQLESTTASRLQYIHSVASVPGSCKIRYFTTPGIPGLYRTEAGFESSLVDSR